MEGQDGGSSRKDSNPPSKPVDSNEKDEIKEEKIQDKRKLGRLKQELARLTLTTSSNHESSEEESESSSSNNQQECQKEGMLSVR